MATIRPAKGEKLSRMPHYLHAQLMIWGPCSAEAAEEAPFIVELAYQMVTRHQGRRDNNKRNWALGTHIQTLAPPIAHRWPVSQGSLAICRMHAVYETAPTAAELPIRTSLELRENKQQNRRKKCPDLASGHHRIMEPRNGALVMMVLNKGIEESILTHVRNRQQRGGGG